METGYSTTIFKLVHTHDWLVLSIFCWIVLLVEARLAPKRITECVFLKSRQWTFDYFMTFKRKYAKKSHSYLQNQRTDWKQKNGTSAFHFTSIFWAMAQFPAVLSSKTIKKEKRKWYPDNQLSGTGQDLLEITHLWVVLLTACLSRLLVNRIAPPYLLVTPPSTGH